jgi:hypothetical protein
MDVREMRWEDVDWIHLAQDRENGNAISGCIECLEFLDELSNCQLRKNGSAP